MPFPLPCVLLPLAGFLDDYTFRDRCHGWASRCEVERKHSGAGARGRRAVVVARLSDVERGGRWRRRRGLVSVWSDMRDIVHIVRARAPFGLRVGGGDRGAPFVDPDVARAVSDVPSEGLLPLCMPRGLLGAFGPNGRPWNMGMYDVSVFVDEVKSKVAARGQEVASLSRDLGGVRKEIEEGRRMLELGDRLDSLEGRLALGTGGDDDQSDESEDDKSGSESEDSDDAGSKCLPLAFSQ